MDRKIIVTEDNSKTLLIPSIDETYHSTHGAYNEALHVFIHAGIGALNQQNLRIFEMGFGTGLNALVTLNHAMEHSLSVEYTSIEKHPLSWETVSQLDYPQLIDNAKIAPLFEKIHNSPWEKSTTINDNFNLKKLKGDVGRDLSEEANYDLVFYDAFGPRVQPELWTEDVLQKMFDLLKHRGILTTYCAQGQFKRNLKKVGFTVENLPGPPGKREMTRAIKPSN